MTITVSGQRLASTLLGVAAAVALLVAGASDTWGLAWFGYGLVGALILWHRPGHRIGWLSVAVAMFIALSDWGQRLVGVASGHGPVVLEQAAFVAGTFAFLSVIAIVALFPSGFAASRLSRLVWLACRVLVVVLPVAVVIDPRPLQGTGRVSAWAIAPAERTVAIVLDQGFLLVPLLLLLGLVSLVPRWRASAGIERQQYRWFIGAILISMVALAATYGTGGSVLLVAAMNAIPVALAVAVTRYGLFDLDRVVSRSASYAIVTGVLLATYALVVTSASLVLGETSTLAVALATLVAAAMFQPLLRRVQRIVDRRFNRQRVDHEQAVNAFAGRLRDQLAGSDTGAALVGVAVATLEPTTASLWLRRQAR